jgi:hypothetical protein
LSQKSIRERGAGLQVRYGFEYEVRRPLPEVKAFFSDVSNLERVWPREYALKVIEGPERVVKGARYLVRGRLLGQPVLLPFTVLEDDETTSHHVLEDILGGKLEHFQRLEPRDGSTKVVEEFRLEINPLLAPAARVVLGRSLEYRVEAIRALLEGGRFPEFRDPLRLSIAAGTALSVLGVIAAALLTVWAFPRPVDYVAKLIAWFLLWFFTHDLAHLVVGAVTGVRFSHYYVGLSNLYRSRLVPRQIKTFIVALGIKIDREKTRAGRLGYFAMFVAGPLASMISPFLVPLHLLASGRVGTFAFLLLALSVANVAFTVPFSASIGCIAKGLRALKKG